MGGNACLNLFILILVQAWIAIFFSLQQLGKLLLSFEPQAQPAYVIALTRGGAILVILIPLLLLARFWPQPVFRNVYRLWAMAACGILVFLPAALANPFSERPIAILHLVGVGCLLALIHFTAKKVKLSSAQRSLSAPDDPGAKPGLFPTINTLLGVLAVSICGLFALPWLAWGAFGSPLDALLQLSLGFCLGLAGYRLLKALFFLPSSEWLANQKNIASFFFSGFTASTALFMLAGSMAFPFGGMQIMLMVTSSLLGWLLAGLMMPVRVNQETLEVNRKRTEPPTPAGLSLILVSLSGILLALPLMTFDADELGLILGLSMHEILRYALQATLVGWMVLLISVLATVFLRIKAARASHKREPAREGVRQRLPVYLLLLAMAGMNSLVYVKFGQPGFHGERLFVILKQQADLNLIDIQAPPEALRQAVYQELVQQALASQQTLRTKLGSTGVKYTAYYLVNAIEVPDNPLLRLWLSRQPEVDRILSSPRLRPLPVKLTNSPASGRMDPPTKAPGNIQQVGAERVWRELGIRGEGILIGLADSGAQADHPNFADRYRGRGGQDDYNWLDPWFGSPSPYDPNGHGTHTLGTILGQFTGVAPAAEWIACANLPRNLGNPALYLDCWQFLFAPYPREGNPFRDGRPELGAQIINNSWGCPAYEGCEAETFLQAVRALRLAGLFIVAGAGNEGPACSSINAPPANYQQVFSVGAIDPQGQLADFSSLGPVAGASGWNKPDLVAPGVQVLSSVPGSGYQTNSGTSMAGPHVAGAVALMWSANPALIGDIDRTERILHQSAQPYSGNLPNCSGAEAFPSSATGYGTLDVYAAVLLALDVGGR